MSLAAVKPYFRTKLKTLGHTEWTDAFNFENIPSTVLDKCFHLEFGNFEPGQQNNNAIEFEQKCIVRMFTKGFVNTATAMDTAITRVEAFIIVALGRSRLTTTGIKNVKMTSMTFEPIAESNDNVVMARMEFDLQIILDPSGS